MTLRRTIDQGGIVKLILKYDHHSHEGVMGEDQLRALLVEVCVQMRVFAHVRSFCEGKTEQGTAGLALARTCAWLTRVSHTDFNLLLSFCVPSFLSRLLTLRPRVLRQKSSPR